MVRLDTGFDRPARLDMQICSLDPPRHAAVLTRFPNTPTESNPTLQAVVIGAVLYFVWVNIIKFFLDVVKLSSIPGPAPIPVLGNLYDKTALTSVSACSGGKAKQSKEWLGLVCPGGRFGWDRFGSGWFGGDRCWIDVANGIFVYTWNGPPTANINQHPITQPTIESKPVHRVAEQAAAAVRQDLPHLHGQPRLHRAHGQSGTCTHTQYRVCEYRVDESGLMGTLTD